MKKTFKTTIVRDGSMCFIPVPFDPKPVFGKARVPVTVTLNGYTYRSTIASMGDGPCLPLRRSNREAAGLEGGETLAVTLALDTTKREIKPPADLVKALEKAGVSDRWRALSFSHQREHVEAIDGAKKPETRARRIERAVHALAAARSRTAARTTSRAAAESVDAYIAAQPAPARPVLERVRATIRKALPGATEGISYQIAVYKLGGAMVLYFAGFKSHYSIYPATAHVVEALGDELDGFLHSKATIRFPLAGAVPTRLIARIAKLRAAEVAVRSRRTRR